MLIDLNLELHRAAQQGHTAIANSLLEKGSETTIQDKQGLTPLHYAAAWSDSARVNNLLNPDFLAINGYPSIFFPPKKGHQGHNDLVKNLVYSLLLKDPEADKPADLILDCWDSVKKKIKVVYDLLDKPLKGKDNDAIKLISIAIEFINKLPSHLQPCIEQIALNDSRADCPLARAVLKRPLLNLPDPITWKLIQYLTIKDGINYVNAYEHPTLLPAMESAKFLIVNSLSAAS